MKYNKKWLIAETGKAERIKYLFFWGHRPSENGEISSSCFSQWWAEHPFTENQFEYRTAEHYMMAGKARLFDDQEMLDQILKSDSPGEAKKLGRQVKNFEQQAWEKHSCEIVIQANYLKFSQHPDIQEYLLHTNKRVIVEASPRDAIWGIGMEKNHVNASSPQNWRGKNLLGFCLMEVRDLLKETL